MADDIVELPDDDGSGNDGDAAATGDKSVHRDEVASPHQEGQSQPHAASSVCL